MLENIELSGRLQAVSQFVTEGSRVCDVGCDHGFVPIYLVQNKISPYVIAMDAKEGPLRQARLHIGQYELEDSIETRLSKGLSSYQTGEADTLICAGMGGNLITSIMEAEKEKTASFRELIFQPQSELAEFRRFLRMQGYCLTEENMIEEEGKFYSVLKAVKCREETLPYEESEEETWQQRMEDRYGPILLEKKSPVLYRYLELEIRICDNIAERLRRHGLEAANRRYRYNEISKKRNDCLQVMELIKDCDDEFFLTS